MSHIPNVTQSGTKIFHTAKPYFTAPKVPYPEITHFFAVFRTFILTILIISNIMITDTRGRK